MVEMKTRVTRIISQMVSEDRPSDEIADAVFDELREPSNRMLEQAKRHMGSYSSNLAWWNAMLAAAKFEEPKSLPQRLRDFVMDARLAQGDAMERLAKLQDVLEDCGLKLTEQ